MSRSERIRLPERPSIPPTMHALACVAAGMAIASRMQPLAEAAIAVAAAALVIGVAAVLLRERRRACLAFAGAALAALGWSACTARMSAVRSAAVALASRPVSGWTILVTSDQTKTAYGLRCRARASAGDVVADVWLVGNDELEMGRAIRCVGVFQPSGVGERGLEGLSRGISGTVRVRRMLSRDWPAGPLGALRQLRAAAIGRLDPEAADGRAIACALCLGYRRGLAARGLDDAFARIGVAHLVAVSGTHLMVVAALASAALSAAGAGMRTACVLRMGATALFALLCGLPMSALRAWLMLCASTASELAGRRAHAPSSLGAVALACCMVDPACAFDLGFQLSAITVGGISLFAPLASCYIERAIAPARLPRGVPPNARRALFSGIHAAASALGTAAVAQAAALPLVMATFSRVSLAGPIASLLCAPGATAALAGGIPTAAAGLAAPDVSRAAADALGAPLAALARLLARLPLASVPASPADALPCAVALLVLAAALLATWPDLPARTSRVALGAAFALSLCAWCAPRFFAPARIVVLDVGQGDAILVQDGAHALLVDCGPGNAVAEALARQRVVHLDGVLVTHLHDDHVGGLGAIESTIGVDRVFVSAGAADAAQALLGEAADFELEEVALGDAIEVGGFSLEVVWPRAPADGSENAHSVHLLARYGAGGATLEALLTGDGEANELAGILDAGGVGDIDVLKVGHHGSAGSISPSQAEALDPEVSIASVGAGNDYGHPAPECVRALVDAGSLVICTMDAGDVDVRPGSLGVQVMGGAAGCARASPDAL